MKVSSKTWHYKLINFYDFNTARNLCQYMRQLVGASVISIFMAFFILTVFLIFLSPYIYMLTGLFEPTTYTAGIVLNAFAGWLGYKYLKEETKVLDGMPDIELTTKHIDTDGIFTTWIKNMHDKVCILIEFE